MNGVYKRVANVPQALDEKKQCVGRELHCVQHQMPVIRHTISTLPRRLLSGGHGPSRSPPSVARGLCVRPGFRWYTASGT